jgi:hypothetical protein
MQFVSSSKYPSSSSKKEDLSALDVVEFPVREALLLSFELEAGEED